MSLSWISIVLTFSGLFIWWIGNNQPVGFAVFMAGGILWFVAQKIESVEKKVDKGLEDSKLKSGKRSKMKLNYDETGDPIIETYEQYRYCIDNKIDPWPDITRAEESAQDNDEDDDDFSDVRRARLWGLKHDKK